MPSARTSVAAFAHHGGRIDLARAAFPGHADWIDLSTGISPWAYPAQIDPATLHRLPDPTALAALEAAAATTFASHPAHTVAVPGSDLALRLVAALLEGCTPAIPITPAPTHATARVAIIGPGYSGHRTMWTTAHTAALPAAELTAAALTHDAVILAVPNNPDGARIPPAILARTAATLAARNRWLILDEAFADGPVAPHPATITLRSFGKFFGLPGLRLGFVIAPPAFAAALRRALGDWPISGPAIAIAAAAYHDTAWQTAQRTRLADAARRLDTLLKSADLTPIGTAALFRLVETPDAAALFRHLARHAILTRPFADNPRRLRIGLPATATDWARLAAALQARITP